MENKKLSSDRSPTAKISASHIPSAGKNEIVADLKIQSTVNQRFDIFTKNDISSDK
jgi:hypothetical protein